MASASKAVLLTGTASAAVIAAFPGATPARAQTTLPVGTYQWSGYYAGLQAGGVWSDVDDDDVGECGPFTNITTSESFAETVDDTLFGCFPATVGSGPNSGSEFPSFLVGDGFGFDGDGDDDDYVAFTGTSSRTHAQTVTGSFFGYNVQSGPIVFGLEADTSAVIGDGNERDVTFDYFDTDFFEFPDGDDILEGYFGSGTVTGTSNLNWLSTVRGRAGVALGPNGRILLFGTAGVAIGNFENRIDAAFDTTESELDCSDCTFTESSTTDETRIGPVIGGGAEFGITGNMRVGFQYLWTHFNSQSPSTVTFVGDNGGESSKQFDVSVGGESVNYHTVTARFTWAFGGP